VDLRLIDFLLTPLVVGGDDDGDQLEEEEREGDVENSVDGNRSSMGVRRTSKA
jgi:hypothetical protein